MKKRLLHSCLYLLLYAGCATITNPNGGPKDIRPPKLESSIPANKEVNFKGETVTLTFNEDVKLNNAKEEILISPSAGKEVKIEVKKLQVTITPKEGWKDTTTYSIFFRDGIQDITESNVPPNLKLAFSTGPTIDSLSVIGKVTQLLNGVALDKMTVGIYQQDTFDIFTDTARYFTKTDKRGRFSLDNVKNGQYKIYAFDDKNKNLKVDSRTERFGFLTNEIILTKNTDSLRIPMIMLDMRKPKLVSIRNIGSITKIRFNKSITDYKIEGDTTDVTYSYGDNATELNFWVKSPLGDSIKLKLNATDSLQNTVDSIFYVKVTNSKTIKDVFKFSLGQPAVDSETGKFQTQISFSKPITQFNFDSLYIQKDTTEIINLTKDDITSIDVKAKQITISKMLDKKFFHVEKDQKDPVFLLRSSKGFMVTIDSDTSRLATSPIPIRWPEDTGILLIEVASKEKDYIIQLTQGDGKIIRTVKNVTSYKFKGVPAGEYGLRVIVDRNQNDKWDPGNFYKGEEPERVIFYRGSDRKPTFSSPGKLGTRPAPHQVLTTCG